MGHGKYCLRSFTTCIVAAQGQKVPVQPQWGDLGSFNDMSQEIKTLNKWWGIIIWIIWKGIRRTSWSNKLFIMP